MNNLEKLLQQSDELPPLPEIYIRVSELLEDVDSDAYQIGKAVQADISMTARILKLINSAFYGLQNEVTSIPQAVTLLGRQLIKEILMGTVLTGIFDDIDSAKFSMLDFWKHSIKTAIIARHLGMQNAHILDHEAFFTAGLLHDVGRLVIARVAPDSVAEIYQLAREEGVDAVEIEREKLGVTHIDLGAALMKKWKMPSMLTQCVEKHHHSEHLGPFAIDTSIVYLANQLSQQERVYSEEDMLEILVTIPNWQQTQNTLDQIHIACQLADEQWFEVMESLGMMEAESNDDWF